MKNKKIKINWLGSAQESRGFTLVELVVVMVFFMLVVGVSLAILLSIIQSQRRILVQEQMLSQASYAMEYMSKGLRMAAKDTLEECLIGFTNYNYLYTRSNEIEYDGIKFINRSDGDVCQEFYLDSTDSNNNVIKELKNDTNESNSVFLTSEKFDVNYLKFSINGSDGKLSDGIFGSSGTDGKQPRVTIIMGFQVPEDNFQPKFRIQTTVSQRNLNVNYE